MNKFALILIFSVIAFIKGTVDDFNTEPYYSFDWLDEDQYDFKVTYTSDTTTMPTFCYLYNSSKVSKPDKCDISGKTITCTVKGDNCKADGDNPTFKYYYTAYCSTSSVSGYNKDTSADKLLEYVANPSNSISGDDVSVTVAVCNGNFLKYSIFLLSLLIL